MQEVARWICLVLRIPNRTFSCPLYCQRARGRPKPRTCRGMQGSTCVLARAGDRGVKNRGNDRRVRAVPASFLGPPYTPPHRDKHKGQKHSQLYVSSSRVRSCASSTTNVWRVRQAPFLFIYALLNFQRSCTAVRRLFWSHKAATLASLVERGQHGEH